jgi:GNAT superfamily N-acetyltransferase
LQKARAVKYGMENAILRAAQPADVAAIVGMIRELADYEHLTHLLRVTPDGLSRDLFGEEHFIECVVAECAAEPVGFALFFRNYSTFLGLPGLYLEDLYVKPAARRLGLGRALLKAVAQIAVARGYGRFEWSVLDWNASAIAFYEGQGAVVMPDWRICRVTGDALHSLGAAALNPFPSIAGAGGAAG